MECIPDNVDFPPSSSWDWKWRSGPTLAGPRPSQIELLYFVEDFWFLTAVYTYFFPVMNAMSQIKFCVCEHNWPIRFSPLNYFLECVWVHLCLVYGLIIQPSSAAYVCLSARHCLCVDTVRLWAWPWDGWWTNLFMWWRVLFSYWLPSSNTTPTAAR